MRAAILVLLILVISQIAPASTPRPLANHPGNIFVEGEDVVLPPATQPVRIFDYEGKEVPAPGKLPVGYYEARPAQGPRVTFGVVAPLKSPTPANSPISLDVAMAWFYKTPEQQRAVINLCQLAGVNWVRDRLSWPEMESERGKFAAPNIYDDTARLQSEAGLRVLQVSHISPTWANPVGKRLPLDLRDAYRFNREMAKRWKGKVLAIEPWNEADIDVFGGHTGSEMATMQKAAYLGLKAGNPDVIACQNVFAIARQSTVEDFAANDASAYFDTYNLHHYVPFERYPWEYGVHRAASARKPMWVTECNVTVDWADEKTKEPSDEHLRWQANRVAKVYAMSLHEGSVNTFFFILGHYVEYKRQYGLLHEDLTPRPAFVALAAVGRLMADANAMGKWKTDDEKVHAYLFRAKPDGEEKAVLVAWRTGGGADVKLNAPVERVFDHLGRERQGNWIGQLHLSAAPTFAIMPLETAKNLKFDPPPQAPQPSPAKGDAKPSPVVIQALMPSESTVLDKSAYRLAPGDNKVNLAAYNFGPAPVRGELRCDAAGWKLTVEIQPDARIEIAGPKVERSGTLRIDGDFGPAGKTVLSLRFVDEPPATQPAK